MKVGDVAPEFTLEDADGNNWALADYRGQTVVLLFYPGDNTPVCTKQLCSVRDNWDGYKDTAAVVVGISTDSVESHQEFAVKHNFPFTLLSDTSGKVVSDYGAGSWVPGKSARAVVVIDKSGRVAHHNVQSLGIFRPTDEEVLQAIGKANAG